MEDDELIDEPEGTPPNAAILGVDDDVAIETVLQVAGEYPGLTYGNIYDLCRDVKCVPVSRRQVSLGMQKWKRDAAMIKIATVNAAKLTADTPKWELDEEADDTEVQPLEKLSEKEFSAVIEDALGKLGEQRDEDGDTECALYRVRLRTFEDVMMLTYHEGFVVTLRNGQKFQVIITEG